MLYKNIVKDIHSWCCATHLLQFRGPGLSFLALQNFFIASREPNTKNKRIDSTVCTICRYVVDSVYHGQAALCPLYCVLFLVLFICRYIQRAVT